MRREKRGSNHDRPADLVDHHQHYARRFGRGLMMRIGAPRPKSSAARATLFFRVLPNNGQFQGAIIGPAHALATLAGLR
jgi:hypothetical protein